MITVRPDTQSTAENSNDDRATEWPNVERRPLLKALGIGATVSLGSGVVTADQDDAQIHPVFGYAVENTDNVPDDLQPDHEVEMLEVPPNPEAQQPPHFYFEPVGLHVQRGDIVQFTVSTNDHTVTAYHPAHGFQRRVPDGVAPFSSPVVPNGGAWLYRFDQPGVYDVYCGPHHLLGMVMRLVVGDVSADAVPAYVDTFEGNEDPPLEAPFSRRFLEQTFKTFSDQNTDFEWIWPTPVEVLSTNTLDPMRIQDAGTVSYSAVREDLGSGST